MTDYPEKNGGSITIYQIEGQFPRTRGAYSGEWAAREIPPEHFGERRAKNHESWDVVCPLFKEYGSNGECWQKTGRRGFLNEAVALKAFALLIVNADYSKYVVRWRLVRRLIACDVTVVIEGGAKKEKANAIVAA